MYKMSEIIDVVEKFCPPSIAADWDNVGLLLGRAQANVSKILLALDVTDDVVDEAVKGSYCAIFTHHPLMRSGIKEITDKTPFGNRLLTLAENKIAVYSAHTNLDFCQDGVNDQLALTLGLENIHGICEVSSGIFAGRAGTLSSEMNLANFAKLVKEKLHLDHITFCGQNNAPIHKVGVMGGGGANEDFFKAALDANCDVYVTSDIKYSMALAAADIGLNLIDATHYATEWVFTQSLIQLFKKQLPNLEVMVTKIDGQPFKGC